MKTRAIVILVVMLFAFIPSLARADEPESKRETLAIGLGVGVFVMSYGLSIAPTIAADTHGDHSLDALYAPVVGPFIAAGQIFSEPAAGMFGGLKQFLDDCGGVLLIADGVAQLVGVIEIVAGGVQASKHARVQVAPVVSKNTAGIGAAFAF